MKMEMLIWTRGGLGAQMGELVQKNRCDSLNQKQKCHFLLKSLTKSKETLIQPLTHRHSNTHMDRWAWITAKIPCCGTSGKTVESSAWNLWVIPGFLIVFASLSLSLLRASLMPQRNSHCAEQREQKVTSTSRFKYCWKSSLSYTFFDTTLKSLNLCPIFYCPILQK